MPASTNVFGTTTDQTSPARNNVCSRATKYLAGITYVIARTATGMLRKSNRNPESISAGRNVASSVTWLATN